MKYFVFIILTYSSLSISAQTPLGSIRGKLLDADTKAPLIGANVSILNTTFGAATDESGEFFNHQYSGWKLLAPFRLHWL
jgi:hypothetical protein